jgi:hypothetical protein
MVLPPGSILMSRSDPKLPALYLLPGTHPYRNTAFTKEKCPRADQTGFRDFVALVERTEKFMTDWDKHSKTLKVPGSDNAGECRKSTPVSR